MKNDYQENKADRALFNAAFKEFRKTKFYNFEPDLVRATVRSMTAIQDITKNNACLNNFEDQILATAFLAWVETIDIPDNEICADDFSPISYDGTAVAAFARAMAAISHAKQMGDLIDTSFLGITSSGSEIIRNAGLAED